MPNSYIWKVEWCLPGAAGGGGWGIREVFKGTNLQLVDKLALET